MTAENQDIKIAQGESRTIRTRVPKADGTPLDLSGAAKAWWQLKRHSRVRNNPADIFASKAGSITSAVVNGVTWYDVRVEVVPSDTQDLDPHTYYHECKVRTSTGRVYRIYSGAFEVGASLPNSVIV